MDESSGLIYLVRHCATDNDEASHPVLLGQHLNPGLSAAGEKHAQQLAKYFVGKQLSAAYCSPQARALRTAQVICQDLDLPLTFCSSFVEADMGTWEGRTYAEIMGDAGEQFDRFIRDPGDDGYPDGENLSGVCQRAMSMLRRICEQYPLGHTLVVSHKQTIRAALAGLQSLPLYRARDMEQDPGCVNIIRIFRGEMELRSVNWTASFDPLDEEEDEQCDSASSMLAT